MKSITSFVVLLSAVVAITACNKVNYRKTKSGVVYKLFPADNKDSLIKNGQVVKFQVTTRLNDSLMYSSYDKAPAFARLIPSDKPPYNLLSVFPMMKKGDSAEVVQVIDTLIRMGAQLPGSAKKGDRIITSVRILDVFKSDTAAMTDYRIEQEKDRPRQMKEEQAEEAKMDLKRSEQERITDSMLEKSGEIGKEISAMEATLKAKNIHAQKVGRGVFVVVQQQGTGPKAEPGKYVNVKYTGKLFLNDSTFQASNYEFMLGKRKAIPGWDEGLPLFNQGGKGTLYIPGFLGYGANPPMGSPFRRFEPLKFDVEVISVSDTLMGKRTIQ